MSRYADPDPSEAFYAQALATLSGPRRRTAMLMRALNMAYWVTILACLGWLASQAIDRAVPIVDRSQAIVGTGAVPGGPLKVAYRLKRLKVCSTDVSWTEVDGAGEVHRFGPKHIPVPGPAGPDIFTYDWPTSANATPGASVLRVALEYHCPGNYLQGWVPIVEALPDLPYLTLPR